MTDAAAPLETVVIAPPPERLAEEDAAPRARAAAPVASPAPQDALADAISSEVDGLVAAVLGVAPPDAAPDAAPAGDAAVARAPAPAPRPAAAARGSAVASPAAQPSAAAATRGPQVQLGAYLSNEDALRMWRGFRARNGDLLAGRSPAVAPLPGAERTLYRLRAQPFADMAEARALCAALRGRGEDCLLVEPN